MIVLLKICKHIHLGYKKRLLYNKPRRENFAERKKEDRKTQKSYMSKSPKKSGKKGKNQEEMRELRWVFWLRISEIQWRRKEH